MITFCTRKLIKWTQFMSPLKVIVLFQDMMPDFFLKNVGLEISRHVKRNCILWGFIEKSDF